MFAFSCAKHISPRGSSTDLSDSSSYSGCACSLQKAATAMSDVHGSSLGPRILPQRCGSIAANGCEQDERAASGTI